MVPVSEIIISWEIFKEKTWDAVESLADILYQAGYDYTIRFCREAPSLIVSYWEHYEE